VVPSASVRYVVFAGEDFYNVYGYSGGPPRLTVCGGLLGRFWLRHAQGRRPPR